MFGKDIIPSHKANMPFRGRKYKRFVQTNRYVNKRISTVISNRNGKW